PVKEVALKHKIPVLQPSNLKSPEFLEELSSYKADLQVVVAFRMLPESVWSMPAQGTFNLHASLLPLYRGAAPIHWAVMNGEEETGVTTFFLKHEIDTGSIIFQEKEPILYNDTVGTVYSRLMNKGGQLVLRTVEAIRDHTYKLTIQDETQQVKHAPKIFRETCEINWNQKSESVRNFVRGLNPFPVAWKKINDKTFKIFAVSVVRNNISVAPGQVETDHKTFIKVATLDGWISIEQLQLEGKKKMNIIEFFRGNDI
ncbi:MAG: methionyl-tRNA formyltransferase, partial [Chryseolinea sp.]